MTVADSSGRFLKNSKNTVFLIDAYIRHFVFIWFVYNPLELATVTLLVGQSPNGKYHFCTNNNNTQTYFLQIKKFSYVSA